MPCNVKFLTLGLVLGKILSQVFVKLHTLTPGQHMRDYEWPVLCWDLSIPTCKVREGDTRVTPTHMAVMVLAMTCTGVQ